MVPSSARAPFAVPILVLGALLSTGCGLILDTDLQSDGGVSDARAPDGSPDSARLDGSRDATGSDGMVLDSLVMDSLGADAIADAPPTCTGLCGDVNQDGMLDVADERRVRELTAGAGANACELAAADVLLTGTITDADGHIVSALVEGRVSGGCAPCDLPCGDANGDGSLDLGDSTTITSFPVVADFCRYWAADTNGDGVVSSMDAELVTDFVLRGGVEPTCALR